MTVHPICQSVFEKAFPASADAEVVRAVTEGVLLADDLIAHTPFLATPVGKNLRGLMRRAGVMYRFHDLCELGDLPFQTSMVRMEEGSWHCLEIAADSFKAHVCRTDGPYSLPADSETRQDERLVNQLELFAPKGATFAELLPGIRQKYAMLTFSADHKGRIQHVCWGMPPRDGDEWLAHINVLHRIELPVITPAEARPDKTAKLKFKKYVEESLSKKDDEKKSS